MFPTITIPVAGSLGQVSLQGLGSMKLGLELGHKGRGIKPHSHGKGRRKYGTRGRRR